LILSKYASTFCESATKDDFGFLTIDFDKKNATVNSRLYNVVFINWESVKIMAVCCWCSYRLSRKRTASRFW
jgi:hypothetical protein